MQVSDLTESASENQDLLFNNVGGGAYDYPSGVLLGQTTSTLAALTNAAQYTITFRITRAATDAYAIESNLYSGTNTSATALQAISQTTTGASYLTGLELNGLAFGYRQSGTSLATGITLNSVDITTNIVAAIPEASSYAALAGLAGLGFAATRRRRQA